MFCQSLWFVLYKWHSVQYLQLSQRAGLGRLMGVCQVKWKLNGRFWALWGLKKDPNHEWSEGDDEGHDGVDVHHHSGDVDGNADDDDKMTMVMVLPIMKVMMAKMKKKMQAAEPTGRWELWLGHSCPPLWTQAMLIARCIKRTEMFLWIQQLV